MNVKTTPTTDAVVISPPTVEPYEPGRLDSCRCCQLRLTRWDHLRSWIFGHVAAINKARFCPGGKPPTESKGLMEAMMSGEADSFNPCAGVTTPHLHIRCNQCGFQFLMATRQAIGK
jgi:hypothetical protein